MQDVIKLIERQSGEVTSEIIKDLITKHEPRAKKMRYLYEEYKGDVAIMHRKMPDSLKVNNKLAADYRGDIVDTAVGYLFGRPVAYSIDNKAYPENLYNTYNDAFQKFLMRNNIADLDSTTGKKAVICGYGARLCFLDKDGIERVMDVDPWECIFIEEGSTGQTQYALRYYDYELDGKTVRKVEWYDSENVYFYLKNGNEYIPDTKTEEQPIIKHMFENVPLIKFSNNDEEMGDTEKVSTYIDAYDKLMSDAQNEIEEFRLAYMVFKGVEPDEDTIMKARQSGAFGIDAGDDIYFLTKQMQTDFVKEQKETLNDNIYKFAKSVDMQSENFSGASESGESRKWKLLGLENKCIVKERKFSTGLRTMFEVFQRTWNLRGINIDYLDIYWQFGRNIPIELSTEAEINQKLLGTISDRQRLSLLSFVDDVDWELEQMRDSVNLDAVNIDEVETND